MSHNIGVGSTLGCYEIVSTLGAGGAGSVFLAKNQEDGSTCALKVLKPETEANEEIQKRFVREIAVAQAFDSPNVIRFFDCGLGEDGVLYYTMEHIPWGSLKDLLKARQSLPWRDAVECAMQIANGLAHLHEKNVIHRDLKPDNIFLSDDGQLKLGDFGLVRAHDLGRLTLDGSTVGTAKYLAPEQARGLDDLDGRTDLYALGCNLFEMIAGRPPFVSDRSAAGYAELMRMHVEQEPASLQSLVPSTPDSVDQLVAKLLAKKTDDRPKSAQVVVAQMERILGRGGDENLDDVEPDAEEEAESLTARLKDAAEVEAPNVSMAKLAVVALVLIGIVVVAVSMNGGS